MAGGEKRAEQDAVAPASALGFASKAVTKQVQRNFHPWEPPKNAVIAPLPFGPGGEHVPAGPSPEEPDLKSWLVQPPPLEEEECGRRGAERGGVRCAGGAAEAACAVQEEQAGARGRAGAPEDEADPAQHEAAGGAHAARR
eukprot:3059773-Rhodomonas_salina.1